MIFNFPVGTPSENHHRTQWKPHTKFGAFIRSVTQMAKFDANSPYYKRLGWVYMAKEMCGGQGWVWTA